MLILTYSCSLYPPLCSRLLSRASFAVWADYRCIAALSWPAAAKGGSRSVVLRAQSNSDSFDGYLCTVDQ